MLSERINRVENADIEEYRRSLEKKRTDGWYCCLLVVCRNDIGENVKCSWSGATRP